MCVEVASAVRGLARTKQHIVNDVGRTDTDKWYTCTIPESFVLGDPSLPADDPSRTLKVTIHPFSYNLGPNPDWDDDHPYSDEQVQLDWYQLSTYKIFPDCP